MRLILWLMWSGFTLQGCGPGCLTCNALNQCLFCDISANYSLTPSGCVLASLPNCRLPSPSGECLACLPQHVLNQTSRACVPVPSRFQVAFCAEYDPSVICSRCADGFYLDRNQCLLPAFPVANCAHYSRDSECKQCNSGFLLADNCTACLPQSLHPYCAVQTMVSCRICAPGFFLDPNLYRCFHKNSTFLRANFINSLIPGFFSRQLLCAPIADPNCIVANNTVCLECRNFFYPREGRCVPIPKPSIANCLSYTSDSSCANCVAGFYLKTPILCEPATDVDNCVAFFGNSTTPRCSQCISSYFLAESGLCVPRISSFRIQNCQEWSLNEDTCNECLGSLLLTSDKLNCIAGVNNCFSYQVSTLQTPFGMCLQCLPGFYLNGNSCKQTSLVNCYRTQTDADVCVECLESFYVWNGLCLKHATLLGCAKSSLTAPNTCLRCQHGFANLLLAVTCVRRALIIGCQSYSLDALTCLACQNGYYLSVGKCAVLNRSIQNCITQTASGCTRCQNKFMLDPSGSCVPVPLYVTEASLVTSDSNPLNSRSIGISIGFDAACAFYHLPIATNPMEAVCVHPSTFYLASNFITITNCKRYGLNLIGQFVCMECISGLFLTNYVGPRTFAVIRCATCNTANNFVLPDDLFGSINVCLPFTAVPSLTGCAMAGRTTAVSFANNVSPLTDFQCVKASSGFVFQFSFSLVAVFVKDTLVPEAVALEEVGHGLTLYETNGQPLAFNYRGVSGMPVNTISVQSTSLCDIYWYPGLSGSRGTLPVPALGWPALVASVPYCLRCNFGTAQIVWLSSATVSYPSCAAMPQNYCQASVVYGGLPSFLNAAFSCHFCMPSGNTQNYPTVYVQYGDAGPSGAPPDYNLWYQFAEPNGSGVTGFTCGSTLSVLTADGQTMGGSGAAGPQTVTGCGSYGIVTPVSSTRTLSSAINVCLSCQSGYYPTYNPTTGANFLPIWAVSSCTVIVNCDATVVNTFNGCGRCVTSSVGAVTVYRAFSDWSLIRCEQSATPFCFILLSPTSSLTFNNCTVCSAGFYLNQDGYCDYLVSPNAADSASFVPAYYYTQYKAILSASVANPAGADKIAVRIYYLLQKLGPRYGMTACASGYTLSAPLATDANVCLSSSYLSTGNALPTLTAFIQNCVSFNNSVTPYLCSQCKTNFIPTIDGKTCVGFIKGCLFTHASPMTSKCALCQSFLLNFDGKCSLPVIPNCQSYRNSPTTSQLPTVQCQQCQDGYFLSPTQQACLKGIVSNCRSYQPNNPTLCLVCLSGYFVLGATSPNVCAPIDPSTKCMALANQPGVFNCTSCLQTPQEIWGALPFLQTVSSISSPASICNAFGEVPECVEYSQNEPIAAANNYTCTRCSPFFYLNTAEQRCIQRLNVSPLCRTYQTHVDSCQTCFSNAYFDAKTGKCVQNPTGQAQCIGYTSNLICIRCRPPFYLFNKACFLASVIIPNCAEQVADGVCAACEPGYFLMASAGCVRVTARNCLEISSPTSCASCDSGFSLSPANLTIDCMPIQIQNCNQTSNSPPYTCIICNPGYFPSANGTCLVVTIPTPNCLLYFNVSVCLQCQLGYVLSLDAKSCLSEYREWADPNCLNLTFTNTSSCLQCEWRYGFSGGSCQEMTTVVSNPGCLVFHPDFSDTCLMCRPEHFQDKTGSCIFVSSFIPKPTPFLLKEACRLFAWVLLAVITEISRQ